MNIHLLLWFVLAQCLIALPFQTSAVQAQKADEAALFEGKAFIRKLSPHHKDDGGSGYELVYVVDAPLDAYWRFKTDFSSDFIISNKFIISHRLISYKENVVVTEDVFNEDLYTHKPNAKFRWQTTLLPAQHRLEYVLLNPVECGQKFHHGSIQLEAAGVSGRKTKVTQTAHFDFFGVSFWVNYPWYGGMKYFLAYTARWEQDTILRLKSKYIQKSAQ